MAAAEEIRIRTEGQAGRITLNRPQALNALTYGMIMAITEALVAWHGDPAVALVIIDAEGDRAFCAGGDIEELYRTGRKGDFGFGRKFWQDEYRLNALIAEYRKPFVAFMHGFVMGGGVGVSCHGSHRIVCESTRIAMPECLIGLVPDVGGSRLLANAPGHLGEYFAMTGMRMNAADAMHCGFADWYVPQPKWDMLKAGLCESGDPSSIATAAVEPEPSSLPSMSTAIDAAFAAGTAFGCVKSLERWIAETGGSDWASEAVKAIRRGCPLSVACALQLVRMARGIQTVREALAGELRFTWRSMSDGEFLEGVRAQIIDKDRQPKWRTPRLEDVTASAIAGMLAPLAETAEL